MREHADFTIDSALGSFCTVFEQSSTVINGIKAAVSLSPLLFPLFPPFEPSIRFIVLQCYYTDFRALSNWAFWISCVVMDSSVGWTKKNNLTTQQSNYAFKTFRLLCHEQSNCFQCAVMNILDNLIVQLWALNAVHLFTV